MKSKLVKMLFFVICVMIIVLLGCFIFYPVSPHTSRRPIVVEFGNMAVIGQALGKYKTEHGYLPSHLSELVPSFVSSSNINCFFWPPITELYINVSDQLLHKIDDGGAFVYLGGRGVQEDLVLYERPNLWLKDSNMTEIVTLTTNFTARLRSAKDVEDRIAHLSSNETKP